MLALQETLTRYYGDDLDSIWYLKLNKQVVEEGTTIKSFKQLINNQLQVA